MAKGLIGDQKGLEERKMHAALQMEERKTHNHELTKQARAERRERHRLHTMMKRQDGDSRGP